MPAAPSSKIWLTLGASLAVSGGFAIIVSLSGNSLTIWVGVGLVAAGSLSLRKGLGMADGSRRRRSPRPEDRRSWAPPATAKDVEPELLRQTPRPVEMTPRGKAIVSVWLLTIATFATLAHQHFGRLPPPGNKDRLDSEGISATAEIHTLEARAVDDERTMYFVGYRFATASGTPVRISRSVRARVHDRLAEGATTTVVYFPGNPELHYLPDMTSPVSNRIVFFAGGLLLAAAGFAEAQRRLHRSLVATGAAVSGITADVHRRGGVRSFRVNFEVAGSRQSLKARERNSLLRDGQRATVLYDPSAATRAVIYRLALYRVRAHAGRA